MMRAALAAAAIGWCVGAAQAQGLILQIEIHDANARPVSDEERQRYSTAVVEAVDRCSPMPFTEQMGGAVAGRTLRVNFLDRRNSRKAEVSWLKKTS